MAGRSCSGPLLEDRSHRGVKGPQSVRRDLLRASVCRPAALLPSFPCSEASPSTAVFSVGGCLAGMSVSEAYRASQPRSRVTLFRDLPDVGVS